MTGARSIVFIDRPDWHARQLAAAFAKAGVEPVLLSLRQCGFAGTAGGARLRLPSFEDGELPLGAFVRSISAGSFEQVTLRLGVLHALRESGVLVYNDARAIERCVDKSMTSFMLQRAGVPTPPTWAVESLEAARAVVRTEASLARPLVLKPLFGSQGRGLALIESEADLPPADALAGVYYLQHFVGEGSGRWRDWRVFVAGGQAVAAMLRHGVTWKTNAAQGAACEAVEPDGQMSALAAAAAAAVGAGFAGVDIIRDASGRLLVLEVNSNPAWSALQRVTRRPIAEALVADFLSRAAVPVDASHDSASSDAATSNVASSNVASSTGR
jgi:tetrahydromethanopterin:alpha-L-glutamate ligase